MTSDAFLALLDTLLPGDEGDPRLPPFSQAGIDATSLVAAAQPLLARIDQDAFLKACADDGVATVRKIEQDSPDAFRALLNQVLAAYYQAPLVLTVLGWRSEPPQPSGHRLAGSDAAALALLDKVRRRGAIWRG